MGPEAGGRVGIISTWISYSVDGTLPLLVLGQRETPPSSWGSAPRGSGLGAPRGSGAAPPYDYGHCGGASDRVQYSTRGH